MAHGLNKGIAKALAILSVVAMMGSPAHADDSGVSLPQTGAEPVAVRLSATTPDHADASERLQVFVGEADSCCEGRTPMAGRYALTDDTLAFSPSFGFEPGQDYVVLVRTSGEAERLLPFQITSPASQIDATVTEIFPSGNTLPENTLRFYIHFSVPMAPLVAFDYIKLRDDSGAVDDAAFMQFKQELWNANRTRLTVLIDPGRIKRNVATNVELGPALLAGNEYTLSIEGGWPSADGTSVLPGFSKHFAVGEALRTLPDVKLWQAMSPCLGTKEPLIIDFDRPFDRHLLTKDIHLVVGNGHVIEGIIQVGDGESSWSFIPNEPWRHEDQHVVANTELEDVAGNNFRDVLDQAVSAQNAGASVAAMTVHLKTCSGSAGNKTL